MTPVIIDRIEEDVAVVELRADLLVDLPLALLPVGIQEGDRLALDWRLLTPSDAPAWETRPARPSTPFGSTTDEDGAHGAVVVVAGRPEPTEASASPKDDHADRHPQHLP